MNEVEGLRWARAEPNRRQKVQAFFGRLFHISMAASTPTLGSTLWFLLRLSLVPLIATAPLWPRWFEGEASKQEHAAYYAAAIIALLVGKWLLDTINDKVKVASKNRKHRDAAALEQRNLFTEMIQFADVPEPDFDSAPFMGIIARTLSAIHDKVREELGSLDAPFLQVSLMMFTPGGHIEVVARAGSRRQTRQATERRRTMAYFVAKARLPWKRVPDLKSETLFVHEGISQQDCPYRSVLLIPVMMQADGNACGVITIDSSRAYEFWNYASSQNIFIQVMPFVRLAAILLQEHKERV